MSTADTEKWHNRLKKAYETATEPHRLVIDWILKNKKTLKESNIELGYLNHSSLTYLLVENGIPNANVRILLDEMGIVPHEMWPKRTCLLGIRRPQHYRAMKHTTKPGDIVGGATILREFGDPKDRRGWKVEIRCSCGNVRITDRSVIAKVLCKKQQKLMCLECSRRERREILSAYREKSIKASKEARNKKFVW